MGTKVRPRVPPSSPPPGPPTSPPPASPPPPPPLAARLGSYGNASIDNWDSAFLAAAAAVKKKKGVSVNPLVMKGIMVVETGGDGTYPASRCRAKDSFDDVPACGPMQVKYEYHKLRCPECDFSTVPGQIELATHIIGDAMKARGGDEYDALTASYFPADDPGHSTQNRYVARVKALVAQMGGTTPAPKPAPVDPLKVILGGRPYPPIDYGFLADVGINSYAFVVNHGGTRSTQHSGIDIGVPHGTAIFAPLPGRVLCVGNQGQNNWGQGCGFYNDDMYGGPGNITILHDGDLKITYGHCSRSLVTVGQRVAAGQQIGATGGSSGDHLHLEATIERNGTYWLIDPVPALKTAMGGQVPVVYAEPVDVPQPDNTPPYVTVRALRKTAVRQRASPIAPELWEPLEAGTEFSAQHQVIGGDGKWWYVGRLKGRVASEDCEIVHVVLE